ncbi:MAG: hypothetical protein R8K46_11235 [Mariprofundaceae bacterium]
MKDADPEPVKAAYQILETSMMYLNGEPVGTLASIDNGMEKLNYSEPLAKV